MQASVKRAEGSRDLGYFLADHGYHRFVGAGERNPDKPPRNRGDGKSRRIFQRYLTFELITYRDRRADMPIRGYADRISPLVCLLIQWPDELARVRRVDTAIQTGRRLHRD